MTATEVALEQVAYWRGQGLTLRQMCATVRDDRGASPTPDDAVEAIGAVWCGLASVRAERLAEAGTDA